MQHGDASKAAPGIIVVNTTQQLSVAENRKPPSASEQTHRQTFLMSLGREPLSSMNGLNRVNLEGLVHIAGGRGEGGTVMPSHCYLPDFGLNDDIPRCRCANDVTKM